MRALFIDSRSGGDWSLDLLYGGLARALGVENVVDFPAHRKHRIGSLSYNGDIEHDWGEERASLAAFPGWESHVAHDEAAVVEMVKAGAFDVVFVDEQYQTYELYLKTRANFFGVPVVVVAGHDDLQASSIDEVVARYGRNLLLAFLDNWQPRYDELPFARPYCWSANFDHLWDPSKRDSLLLDKRYDVCFIGYCSSPSRARFVDHVLSRGGQNAIVLERKPDTFSRYVLKREYFETMARSKVCLNVNGAARNGKALRFWEAPYVGSCMLSQRFKGLETIDPAFLDGIHCMSFTDEVGLDRCLDTLLSDDVLRERIARNGHDLLMREHLSVHKARRMIAEIEAVLRR